MEILNALQWDKLHLDGVIILLVISSGYFQKKYLSAINISPAWKTLLVSFVFTLIYLLLLIISQQFKTEKLIDYFISFAVATSIYDLLVKNFIKKIFPNSDN